MEILDVVLTTITLVAFVAPAVWVARKIRSGDDYTKADPATWAARGRVAGHHNHGGFGGSGFGDGCDGGGGGGCDGGS